MERSSLTRLSAAGSEQVLRQLTIQQHLKPSRSVRQTVAMLCRQDGFPESAGETAIATIGALPDQPVGRLSRMQVRELAQRIEFAWQTELADHFQTHHVRH